MDFLSQLPGLKDKINWRQVNNKNKKILFQNLEIKCFKRGDYLFYKNEACKAASSVAYVILFGEVSFLNEIKHS